MTFIIFLTGNVLFFSPVYLNSYQVISYFVFGMNDKIVALILSGGKSERMGVPKAFLKAGNTTFLEKIISSYQQVEIDKIIVVINRSLISDPLIRRIFDSKKNIELVCNSYPELGRGYSIKLGVQNLPVADYCFIQNIDNPFVDVNLLNDLLKNKNPLGYSLPFFHGQGGHPVLASKKIIESIMEMNGFDFKLNDLLKKFNRKQVEVNRSDIMININTKEDYFKKIIVP